MKRLVTLELLLVSVAQAQSTLPINPNLTPLFPAKPANYVTDLTNTLDFGVQSTLNTRLKWLKDSTRVELAVVILPTVKDYADVDVATEIAQARAKLGGVINVQGQGDMQQLAQASSTLSGTIGRLLVLSERYPELKASETFRDLQSQIEGTENRISVARQDYNGEVQQFNAMIKVFPSNIIANFMGVGPRQFFDVTDSSTVESAPVIQLTPR